MHITVILKWKEKRKWCVTSVNKVVRSAIVVGKQLKMNYLHGQKYDFDDVDVGKIATKSTNGTFTKYLEMILEVVITESCYQSVLLTGSIRFIVLQKVRKNMDFHQARKKRMVPGTERTILKRLVSEKERRLSELVIVKKNRT